MEDDRVQSLAELVLQDEPDAVPKARRFAAKSLRSVADSVREDVELLVTELATNAVLHGSFPVTVRVLEIEDGVRVEVEDAGRLRPIPTRPSTDSMTGRGIALVDAIAARWGVDPSVGGKVVWAEVGEAEDGNADLPMDAGLLDSRTIDELLESWPSDEPDEGIFTVRLGAVPTDLLLAAKAHIDNVIRELTLVKADEATSGIELPTPIAALVETVTTEFAEARAEIKRQALAAAARGEGETELVLSLPLSAAPAGERYLAALDEADRYARAARLLTMAAPKSHRVFRHWYVQSLVDQLRAVGRGRKLPTIRPFPQVMADEIERLSSLEDTWNRLQLLQKVNQELTNVSTVDDIASIVVDNASQYLGPHTVRIYLTTSDRMLRSVAIEGPPNPAASRYQEFSIDDDLPGSVVARSGEPMFFRGIDRIVERFPVLAGVYLTDVTLHVVPLRVGEHILGVLTMTFPGSSRVDEDTQIDFVGAIADALAQALERAEASERAERALERLSFLADASVALSSSLNYDATIDAVASLLVPTLADWCLIEVLRDGELETVALRHKDPAMVEYANSLSGQFPTNMELDIGAPAVVRTGQSEFYPELSQLVFDEFAVTNEHLELIQAFGMNSAMVVPLTGRSGTFGAMTLMYAESGRTYAPDDVLFVEDVARRAALAMETAKRFSETSGRLADVIRVADAAQRAILAPVPSRIGPIALAGRYVSASAEALVGGDIYEIFQRDNGVRLLVGDVRGKGLAAVRTATIVLGEFRAAAADVSDLGRVARQIDRRLRPYLGDEDFATAIVAEVDFDGRFALASCGHPPPILLHDGEVTELSLQSSLPLGLGAEPEVFEGQLEAGDRILLYTDGVIEARDANRRFVNLPRLAERLTTGPLDMGLDGILDRLHEAVGRELGDDVALLVAEFDPR